MQHLVVYRNRYNWTLSYWFLQSENGHVETTPVMCEILNRCCLRKWPAGTLHVAVTPWRHQVLARSRRTAGIKALDQHLLLSAQSLRGSFLGHSCVYNPTLIPSSHFMFFMKHEVSPTTVQPLCPHTDGSDMRNWHLTIPFAGMDNSHVVLIYSRAVFPYLGQVPRAGFITVIYRTPRSWALKK